MARKDDPVFNVKFVQLVENQACLWNYTHPGYSKKEEVQKAWQHVANEIKDTVRNSRERWRTIRSSFLRSLKAARTSTGRGKRKYYLSKYLQFLIPYTKSRACHKQLPAQTNANATPNPNPNQSPNNAGGMVLRKPSTSTTAATFLAAAALSTQPMTRIGHMRLLEHHHHHHHQQHQHQQHQEQQHQHHHTHQVNDCDDNTKDSIDSQPAHVQISEEELDQEQEDEPEQETDASQLAQTPLRLQAIKVEQQQQSADKIVAAAAQHSLVTLPVTMAAALRNNMDWTVAEWLKGSNSQLQLQHLHSSNNNNNSNNSNMLTHLGHAATTPPAASTPAPPAAAAAAAATAATAAAQPDADYSFLISLHPYLKEMSGKQNRRFRQKVVGLIDNVLDNVDV